jgi:hypothetical protein
MVSSMGWGRLQNFSETKEGLRFVEADEGNAQES